MARDQRYDVLFEPVRIGPKTLKNRFYQVPHCTGFGVVKPWTQARHRSLKAEGGWAAVCTEFAPIGPEGDAGDRSSRLWDHGDVRAFSLMCDEVHDHGAMAGIELHHGGVYSGNTDSRRPALAPSAIASEEATGITPKPMTHADIRRVQDDWAAAARRARTAGFDIVYVYGGHTYLPMQFLSRFYNRRTDQYGGSLENRARFWLETLEVVRAAVGDDCAIASRLSVDELSPATVDIDEALEFVSLADHLVDLWDVNVSSITEWSKDSGGSRFFQEGYQAKWTGRVKEVSAKPVVGVSRMTNPDLMLEIVTGRKWDLIGAARPSIADPFLPRKIEEGRLDEIRECVGNNLCIAKVLRSSHLGCTQNATAGEEYRRGWHPERFERPANVDRDVLVLGAGPAGMECAVVLGRRGFRRVHLVDAEPEPGGHLRWLTQLPGLGQWARVTNYRRVQLDKLRNVQFVPDTRLDAAAVREYGGELVVVATGSRWAADGLNGATRGPLPGSSLPHVLTPEAIMVDGRRPSGSRVLVYDCDGFVVAAGLAEKLRGDGYEVELVTPFDPVVPLLDATLEGVLVREHLDKNGISVRAATTVCEVTAQGALGFTAAGPTELGADAIVLVTQRVAEDSLFLELESDPAALTANGIAGVFRVGDCLSPRQIADTIFDGHRLAREIDTRDPSVPKPFLREGFWDRTEALREDEPRTPVAINRT